MNFILTNLELEKLYTRINGCISFVAQNPVRAVASSTQTWLAKWYRDVSRSLSSSHKILLANILLLELIGLRCPKPWHLGAQAAVQALRHAENVPQVRAR